MKRSLLERAASLLEDAVRDYSPAWGRRRDDWLKDYENRCRANYSDGDSMPDHRGCPDGAECEGKDIYWRPA